MENKDIAFVLAKHVVDIIYDDIQKEAIENTKRSILDTLGVSVAGTKFDQGCRQVVELVKEAGGRQESSILVFGGKVPAIMAGFAHGSMAHVLDYDDVVDDTIGHPTAAVLPGALAIAERVGGVSGKELITAVVLGTDVNVRIALPVMKRGPYKSGWFPPTVFGYLGAAATAGKLLGLNEDQMADCLGIAFHQTAGSNELISSGGVGITPLYPAFLAKAGVLSALMAQRGITGIKDCLESKAGFYNLYFGGEYDSHYLTDKLGERFESINVGIKPWPTAVCTHKFITAALDIVHDHNVSPEDVSEIIVHVSTFGQHLCEPLDERQRPNDFMGAGLSIPFTVATAIAKGKVDIGSLVELRDEVTLEVAQKIIPRYDPELDLPGIAPAVIDLEAKKGQMYSKRIDIAYGNPANLMTMEDVLEKFQNCLSYSAKPFSKENMDRIIELILNLEDVDDVNEIIRLLC